MLLVGSGAALYGICTVGYPDLIAPLLFLIVGVVVLERGWSKFTQGDVAPEPDFDGMPFGDDFGNEFGAPDFLSEGGTLNGEAQRVLEVARATWPEELIPAWDKFELKDGVLVSYGFKATKPGFFTDDGVKTRVVNKLTNAVEASQGSWAPDFDVKTDTLMVTQRSSFPPLVVPPSWPVVRDKEDAQDRYASFEYSIGIDKDGKQIKFSPGKAFPHMGMYGTTGGGKSVATRSILAQWQALGAMIFAVDGKNTDYAAYMREQGYVAVSTNTQEHIVVVHMVRNILAHRQQAGSKLSKQGDTSWKRKLTPVLLVLDEFASVLNNLKSDYPKEFKRFIDDITYILKIGREMRVHLILATQGMYADGLPGDWLNNIAVHICMGKPDDMILRKAFPEEIRGEARLKGDTISKKTRGRGIVSITTEKGTSVELFQSYYGYSPAEDMEAQTPYVQSEWRSFKQQVSDRIPKLYARQWFVPEYPETDDGKDPYEKLRAESEENGGTVDLSKLTIEDLHKLKPIALENASGPIPGNVIYDPLMEEYIGGDHGGGGAVVDLDL
jgi:hypothetical protein